MTIPDPTVPPPLADLLTAVGRAYEGDADAIEDVVTGDVAWIDADERLAGVDEVVGHFLAHGGWREVFEVRDVAAVDPRRGIHDVAWTLWLRADSTSYRRDGVARIELVDGRIARWESTAVEREDGSLDAWSGD